MKDATTLADMLELTENQWLLVYQLVTGLRGPDDQDEKMQALKQKYTIPLRGLAFPLGSQDVTETQGAKTIRKKGARAIVEELCALGKTMEGPSQAHWRHHTIDAYLAAVELGLAASEPATEEGDQ